MDLTTDEVHGLNCGKAPTKAQWTADPATSPLDMSINSSFLKGSSSVRSVPGVKFKVN